jgi:Co/Zn/Cd efflux system component/copper chaperone CopZ
MDCASDAAEIEAAARMVAGVDTVRVSTASQIMTLHVSNPGSTLPKIEETVAKLGYRLTPVPHVDDVGEADDSPKDRTNVTPQYKRALWIVVALNIGYGLVEIVAGLLSGSQALKADALDFLGDGLITFLGLLAIGWRLSWRARSALIQGLFLGTLGLGVLVTTGYRVLVQQRPEAEIMGVVGLVALAVNVASALLLLPHRTGDANTRAVWMFSRNDAIGNAAVVVAAILVAWTNTSWPDLAVAAVIAGLFLQSSRMIVRDARADLKVARNRG